VLAIKLDGRRPIVYVTNQRGRPMLLTKLHRKIRCLLQEGKAKVAKRTPFTILLANGTSSYTSQSRWVWTLAAK